MTAPHDTNPMFPPSRAKELFILVGNLERLSEGGYTKQLVEYIKEWGQIRR